MIAECEFKLVGIVLTFNRGLNTLKIDHVYKANQMSELSRFVIQHGREGPTSIPFSGIVTAFADAYSPVLQKIWVKQTKHTNARYYQLAWRSAPHWVGLTGDWKVWAQK